MCCRATAASFGLPESDPACAAIGRDSSWLTGLVSGALSRPDGHAPASRTVPAKAERVSQRHLFSDVPEEIFSLSAVTASLPRPLRRPVCLIFGAVATGYRSGSANVVRAEVE